MLLLALVAPGAAASAQSAPPGQTAETIRSALFQAQLALGRDPASAAASLEAAQAAYLDEFAPVFASAAPQAEARIRQAFAVMRGASAQGDVPAFAAARASAWTGILAASYQMVETALAAGTPRTAQEWLPVREFRVATRFSRPDADATLAVDGAVNQTVSAADAILSVRADVLDTYQARLNQALRDLPDAHANNFPSRSAELAALVEGYFLILAPAYGEQRGEPALAETLRAFASLRTAALAEPEGLPAAAESVQARLKNFRAAPLSPAEQARRAGQLLRYLALVPVEYGRGVSGGVVTRDFEIQEAITFLGGARAAFEDLESLLDARDNAATGEVARLLQTLDAGLVAASTGRQPPDPREIQAQADQAAVVLRDLMPQEWQSGSAAGDFDVIASLLDQMESAVRAGDYPLAESARLEAYAVLETGPEARLTVFAPQLKLRLEELFWNGQGEAPGLAYLIARQAPRREVGETRAALDRELETAQALLGERSAPAVVGSNAAIIVFREGLEAVLILASLMGSLKLGEARRFRRPMWLGAGAALAATVLTWMLARGLLASLARYGEKLEAAVSLAAIAMLLLITNWFFHKTYWNEWLAGFHARKQRLIGGEAGLWLGLATLGFTSVYREGFETVLFLQALVLEGGAAVVLGGVAAGLAATVLVGLAAFRLQTRLPYKKMLIVTGILIGAVLLVMVGNTAHAMQVVGWLPIHPIAGLALPYWLGAWFGVYPTWEGLLLQTAAAAFVIGSYYLAERLREKPEAARRPAADGSGLKAAPSARSVSDAG